MAAYLIDHPPRVRQFRDRGTKPSGVIVVHTAESTPDWVGPDAGAEAVAKFISTRSDYGSYHKLSDSDSRIQVVPFEMQAYGDGTGSNPHAIHLSAATQAAKWMQATKAWREATVKNMARDAADAARWLKKHHDITVPARRITRAQSEARVPGFISHGERDPGRRSDPGPSFPWDLFLKTYAAEMGGTATTEETDMPSVEEIWAYPINLGDKPWPARTAMQRAVTNGWNARQEAKAALEQARRNRAALEALSAKLDGVAPGVAEAVRKALGDEIKVDVIVTIPAEKE